MSEAGTAADAPVPIPQSRQSRNAHGPRQTLLEVQSLLVQPLARRLGEGHQRLHAVGEAEAPVHVSGAGDVKFIDLGKSGLRVEQAVS